MSKTLSEILDQHFGGKENENVLNVFNLCYTVYDLGVNAEEDWFDDITPIVHEHSRTLRYDLERELKDYVLGEIAAGIAALTPKPIPAPGAETPVSDAPIVKPTPFFIPPIKRS